MQTLDIYEIDYSVSPGGINTFEIYNEFGEYICDFEHMIDACSYAYKNGYEYTVHLLANYRSSDTPAQPLTNVSAY